MLPSPLPVDTDVTDIVNNTIIVDISTVVYDTVDVVILLLLTMLLTLL